MARLGKFNTKLWVKAVKPRTWGQCFQFRVPLLKHPSNAPHGWCVHKTQPNLSMSVGPIPVQSMAQLGKLTLIEAKIYPGPAPSK